MNNINLKKIAAFTANDEGGNSAGLVWPANNLRINQRQALATKAGYSETAFVDRSVDGDLRFEYFTPNRQIEICGHATVAAFSYLRDIGEVGLGSQSFDSLLGKQKVEVRRKSVGLWQEQLSFRQLSEQAFDRDVADSLAIDLSQIVGPLRIASNGAAFLLIPLDKHETLKKLNPEQEKILKISEDLKIVGFYAYYLNSASKIETRMFAPRYGIAEESATGMAAGALAIVLHKELGDRTFRLEQGHLMPSSSPSILFCEVFEERKVLVSGEARLISELSI